MLRFPKIQQKNRNVLSMNKRPNKPPPPIFGVIVPERSCNCQFNQVGKGKFVTGVDNRKRFTQMMVFKLPGTPNFPKDFGAAIYISDKSKNFQYMDFINDFKQSALIEIPENFDNVVSNTVFGDSMKDQKNVLFVGLNLENRDTIQNLESGRKKRLEKYSSQMTELAKYIGESLANYVASFSRYVQNAGKEMVVMDLNEMSKWFKKFQHKMKVNPFFWKSQKKVM